MREFADFRSLFSANSHKTRIFICNESVTCVYVVWMKICIFSSRNCDFRYHHFTIHLMPCNIFGVLADRNTIQEFNMHSQCCRFSWLVSQLWHSFIRHSWGISFVRHFNIVAKQALQTHFECFFITPWFIIMIKHINYAPGKMSSLLTNQFAVFRVCTTRNSLVPSFKYKEGAQYTL